MKAAKRTYFQILLIFLTITLVFPRSTWAQVTALEEARYFLRNYYAEPIREDILNYPTIDEILTHLDDPYTDFMTSEQYQEFYDYLELRYTGIGIYIDIVEDGIKVTGLVSDSPAEKEGLQAGDIITALDGRSLKGLPLEDLLPLMQGPEGSSTQLVYLRDGKSFTVEIERVYITIPSVNYDFKSFNTGYIDISSFNDETGSLFAASLDKLRLQNPNYYIIDLRDNGGGYVQSALDIAGYFIGDKVATQVYSRDSSPYKLRGVNHSYILDKPTIILINSNTASASELLSMAVRDNNKALLIGTTTYGKGCGQKIFPLSSNGYLKMTTAYFRSPSGKSINKIGIAPDLLIEKANPLKVALLLRSGNDSVNNNDLVKFTLVSQSLMIDTKQARTAEYWQAYGEVLDRVGPGMMQGKDGGWESVTLQELNDRRLLYYPDYFPGNQVPGVITDNQLTIHFPNSLDWKTINQDNIELIASSSGERVPLAFTQLSGTDLYAIPQNSLLPDTTYWLVLHPGLQYADGSSLPTGTVFSAVVKSTGPDLSPEEQANNFTVL